MCVYACVCVMTMVITVYRFYGHYQLCVRSERCLVNVCRMRRKQTLVQPRPV